MTFELHRADARHLPLPDATVDLIVTSPPYFALRSYQDDGEHYQDQIGSEATPADFLRALWAVLDECWRVLKPSGSCFVNLGDKFAGGGGYYPDAPSNIANPKRQPGSSIPTDRRQQADVRPKSRMLLPHRFALGAIDPDYRTHVEGRPGDWPQWVCRMDIVWAKPNGLPESVTDRVRASHEYFFHLTRSERYFAAVDEVREEHSGGSHVGRLDKGESPRNIASAATGDHGVRPSNTDPDLFNPLGKLPGSVWTIPSEPLRVPDHLPQHFAAFPSEFPRRLIAGWSPTGICTVCGEGRRPVVEDTGRLITTSPLLGGEGERYGGRPSDNAPVRTATGWALPRKEQIVTGYACACPQPDAPTRPAVVLDPFVGTGTTVAVAHHLGRHGIGVDLSADYLRLARWRCEQDWSLYTKATGGDPDTRDPDQLALFEVDTTPAPSRVRNPVDQPGPTGSRHAAAHPLGPLPGSVWTIDEVTACPGV